MNIDIISKFTTNHPTKINKERVIKDLADGKAVTLRQPCNCGENIRHYNGGNYHFGVTMILKENKVFLNWRTTSELELSWFAEQELLPIYEILEFLEDLESLGFEVVG